MKTLMFTALALSTAAQASAQTPNPTAAQTQAARNRSLCGDPWVTIALETVYGSVDRRRCFVALYAGGQWRSYDELLRDVRAKSYSFRPMRITGDGRLAGQTALGIFSGASLVAAGGGNMVAAGGGNMVAAGGGNILYIVQNGLVSPGGGNYSLQSTGRAAPVIG